PALPAAPHPAGRGRPGELRVLPRLGDRGPGLRHRHAVPDRGHRRPRIEPSFVPDVIDLMLPVPDAASIAAMRHLESVTGLCAGGSTGTNLWGVWQLIARMLADGTRGSVVTLICDGGDRYRHSYYDDSWVAAQGMD